MYAMSKRKTAPCGMINVQAEPIIAAGAAIGNIPWSIDWRGIRWRSSDGDWVRIDADRVSWK